MTIKEKKVIDIAYVRNKYGKVCKHLKDEEIEEIVKFLGQFGQLIYDKNQDIINNK